MEKAIYTLNLMLALSVAALAQNQTEPDLWIYEYKEVILTQPRQIRLLQLTMQNIIQRQERKHYEHLRHL